MTIMNIFGTSTIIVIWLWTLDNDRLTLKYILRVGGENTTIKLNS